MAAVGSGSRSPAELQRLCFAPQVYMFLVKWNDLSEKLVYRRFTEIYEFHVSHPGGGERKGGQIPAEIAPKQTWLKRGSWLPVLPSLLSLQGGAAGSVLPGRCLPGSGRRVRPARASGARAGKGVKPLGAVGVPQCHPPTSQPCLALLCRKR